MKVSNSHLHLHLLILVGLLANAIAIAAAEGVATTPKLQSGEDPTALCNNSDNARLLNNLCTAEIVGRACCLVVRSLVDMSTVDGNPNCLCDLEEGYNDFISSGLGIDDLVDIYSRCQGDHPVEARIAANACGNGSSPPTSEGRSTSPKQLDNVHV